MDIDEFDRTLNYDNADIRKLQAFKVPKKNLKNKCSYEKVALQSNEYKDNIYPKIVTSYKNPNSCISLKILSAYTICNDQVDKSFSKRKQCFKKDLSSQNVECFGFIYVSNLTEFRNIVQNGRLRIGNLKESVLGKANMGVCVSQFSDIYHPGDGKNFPRNGILLIVKYMRGRIYYVVEDNNPMEPQPNYDCHISKNYNQDSYPSMARAFHSTQVYMYEYSDDFDLIDEPSQILPWAAVEFTWIGQPLYKLISIPISVLPTMDTTKDLSNKTMEKRSKSANRITGCPPQRIKQMYTDVTPVFCTQLQLKLNKSQKDDDTSEIFPLDIPVTILSYHSIWIPFDPLMTSSWNLCELMEWSAFEKGFIQPLLTNRKDVGNEENFTITDVFNKRVTINRHLENKFSKNALDSMKLSGFGTQFVNYLRMVVNDPSRDRAKMARLIEHFLETKTVGRICIHDNSDSLLFVFPDSNLSMNFGIPSVKTLDVNYLHLLLVTNKPMDYNLANRRINENLETELKTNLITKCSIQDFSDNQSILSVHVLRQSINCQNSIQKSKLRQICGISTNVSLKFEEINFKIPTASPVDGSKTEDNLIGSNQRKSQNSLQKIESPIYDRPYDPTENLVGLSDVDSQKLSSIKRPNDVKKPEESSEISQPKKVKREDIKNELNNKLFQLFAKIESNENSNDSPDSNPTETYTTPLYQVNKINTVGKSNYHQFNRDSNASSYASTLDRNKFQTQFRNGVSVYFPEQTNNTMDMDFRYQDPLNQQLLYSDKLIRPNGFNR